MNNKTKDFYANKAVFALVTVLSFLASSIIFADGDSRKPTQAEKDFHKSVINALAKALPSGPEGWEKTGECAAITELNTVYSAEKAPLRIEYCIGWQDAKRALAAQIQLNQEVMKVA